MRLTLMSLLIMPVALGCSDKSTEPLYDCSDSNNEQYDLFNCQDDFTLLYVGTPEVWTGESCEGVDNISLRSASCDLPEDSNGNPVGTADITPCGGPIGTEHQIVVRVNNLYKDQVDQATVSISSGDRGEQECMMTPDSADEGLYRLTLVSTGSDDEVRNDTVSIKLWAKP